MSSASLPRRQSVLRDGGGNLARAVWLAVAGVLAVGIGIATAAMPLVPLGLLAVIVAAGAYLTAPVAVLAAIIVLRPALDSAGSTLSFGSVNILGIIGAGTVVGGAAYLAVRRPRLPRGVLLSIVPFLVLALISLTWTRDRADGLSDWLGFAVYPIVFGVALGSTASLRDFRRLVTVVLVAAAVPIVVGLIQLATGQRLVKEGYASIQGTMVHPNSYATFLLVALSIGLVAFLQSRNAAVRRVLAVGLAAAAACFFFTYARGAWGALVVVMAILALLHYRRLIAAGLVAILVVSLLLPSTVSQLTGRFADLSPSSTSYAGNSLGWRQELWSRMLPFAQERPVFGQGIGSFLPLTNEVIGVFDYQFQTQTENAANVEVYPHNDYLFLAVELGVVGLLLWVAFLVSCAAAAWSARRIPELRPYAIAVSALFVAVLMVSATDNMKDNTAALIGLFALAGGVAALARLQGPVAGSLAPQPLGSAAPEPMAASGDGSAGIRHVNGSTEEGSPRPERPNRAPSPPEPPARAPSAPARAEYARRRPSNVDVAIPTHGEGRYLKAAIESVLAQTHERFSLTILDNGPGGGHAEQIVSRYSSDPRVHHVATGGVPADENWSRCIQTGTAPLVTLLPHDEQFAPDFLARRVEVMAAHPEAAFVFSGCRVLDEHDEEVWRAQARIGSGVLQPEVFVPLLYEDNQIPTCSVVVRRTAYEEVGPYFLGEYRMGIDWEMWMRLAVRFPVVHLPLLDSFGRVHSESVSSSARGWGEMRLSMVARADELIARDMPGFELPRDLRVRTVGAAHLRSAYEALEAGDVESQREALHAAIRANPSLRTNPRAVLVLTGAYGGEPVRRAILRARRLETRLQVRGQLTHAAFKLRKGGRTTRPGATGHDRRRQGGGTEH